MTNTFARRPPEPTTTTARRLVAVLADRPKGLTRRQLQVLLFPNEKFDTPRAGWVSRALHEARDRGFIRNYGEKHIVTPAGLAHLEWSEPFTGGAA